jgi:hypothetical protein
MSRIERDELWSYIGRKQAQVIARDRLVICWTRRSLRSRLSQL